jgi:hypothetical protein
MARKTTKKRFSKKQLDTLYECWKDADNYKDRTALIEARLPKLPVLAALKEMRSLAKNETKWLKWAARKKNEEKKEKLAKKKEREQKKEEMQKKRMIRKERKKCREINITEKTLREKVRRRLLVSHYSKVQEEIEQKFFFCNDVQQYVNNISCIFRLFSEQHEFSPGGSCDKCSYMDKHIPTLMEVIKNGRQNRPEPNQTGTRGRKTKIESAKARKTKAKAPTDNK